MFEDEQYKGWVNQLAEEYDNIIIEALKGYLDRSSFSKAELVALSKKMCRTRIVGYGYETILIDKVALVRIYETEITTDYSDNKCKMKASRKFCYLL